MASIPRQSTASICDSQSLALECFERDLLRQHDVAGSQFAFRQEAPFTDPVADRIQFVDVHHLSVADAIALAGVRADDLEISVGAILLGLLGGKPRLEEGDGFLLDLARRGLHPCHKHNHDARADGHQRDAYYNFPHIPAHCGQQSGDCGQFLMSV
jgi:hypothetical protein